MTTIKSFTDLEQSKKLAEILPINSADMWYSYFGNPKYNPTIAYKGQQWFLCQIRNSLHDDIPCWSIAALLSIFDCYEINKFGNNIQFDAKGIALSTKENETILDIVVDTIILLHKQNLL